MKKARKPFIPSELIFLLGSQNTRASSLGSPLTLLAPVKGRSAHVVTVKVVKVLDLVDPDDPVLTGKGLLHSRQLGSFGGKSHTTDTVDGLALLEEGVVVVVGHLVPVDRRWLAFVSRILLHKAEFLTSSCCAWWEWPGHQHGTRHEK